MGRLNRSVAATKYVRKADGSFSKDRRADAITAEEPLEIRVNGATVTTTMRTPGHDLELAHGFLHSEGQIRSAADISTARYCAGAGPDGQNTYNVLDINSTYQPPASKGDGSAGSTLFPTTASPLRLTITNSACGVCGSGSIESIMEKSYRTLNRSSSPLNWYFPYLSSCGSTKLFSARLVAFTRRLFLKKMAPFWWLGKTLAVITRQIR